MAIDIKNLLEFAQRDISTIDSTSNTQTILDLFRLANRAGPTLHMYDSTSDLPNLLDETADTAQLAFVKNRRELYVNRGTWVPQSGNVPVLPVFLQPYTFQGSNFGYVSAGMSPTAPAPSGYTTNVIDKFPFASDENATDIGDLTVGRYKPAGCSSLTHGYNALGNGSNVIDKFPFASDGNATDVGDGLAGGAGIANGNSSADNGYASGQAPTPTYQIQKFSFSSDGNASGVGTLTVKRDRAATNNSSTHGYTSSGRVPTYPFSRTDTIDKFPFASDANATDVGNDVGGRYGPGGQSSTTHGYISGGKGLPTNTITKFPFASDTNATDVSDLTVGRYNLSGQSSSTSGYASGGRSSPVVNTIDKFPFSSDANATDVGDLTLIRHATAGQQY